MRIENIASVVDESIVTVVCTFTEGGKGYVYKVHKTLARNLVPGDYVLTESAEGRDTPAAIAQVKEVHSYNSIEPQSDIVYKWVFAKVRLDHLATLKKQEKELVDELRKRQQQHTREQALSLLGIPSTAVPGILFAKQAPLDGRMPENPPMPEVKDTHTKRRLRNRGTA